MLSLRSICRVAKLAIKFRVNGNHIQVFKLGIGSNQKRE